MTEAPIELSDHEDLVAGDAAGAVVGFAGVVRNHDAGREYSAHPHAEQRLFEVLAEVAAEVAANSSGVHAIAASHRVGPLRVGDAALVVAVSADHRAAAFGTCAVVVERVKEAIPVWKHQFFADGSDEWVNWA